jgi:predicted ATPase
VLLACAFRPAPAPVFLESAIATAEREGRAERLDLGPLSPEAAAELLRDIAEQSVRDAVFRVSGGNPFYLSQLARLAAHQPPRRGDMRTVDTLTLGVPQSVMSMLVEEVRSLPPGSRRVLEAAAVAGEPFEPDVAAEIGEVSDAEVGVALDDLLTRDLVRATDVPRHFRFRHPLVRRAVYANAGGGWRLAAHGRAAAALASRGASAAAQAHHVEHSARRGDERAIALLSRAAASAAPRAPATAARWLQAAVRLVPEDAAHPRVELLVGGAEAPLVVPSERAGVWEDLASVALRRGAADEAGEWAACNATTTRRRRQPRRRPSSRAS